MYYSVISLLALLILLITNHDERKEGLKRRDYASAGPV